MEKIEGHIPFKSWYGEEDFEDLQAIIDLENKFTGQGSIVVDCVQSAVQLCVEVLGSRTTMLPVALPDTAPISAFGGVLWSGALPVVLDTNSVTHQPRVNDLLELREAGQLAAVLLDRSGGKAVRLDVLEAVSGVPTIAVCDVLPVGYLGLEQLQFDFNIYDLSHIVGTGAVIITKDTVRQQQLRLLRGGPLGHRCWLDPKLCKEVVEKLEYDYDRMTLSENVYDLFNEELRRQQIGVIITTNYAPGVNNVVYFHVPDAGEIVPYLRKFNIPCRRTFYPLHTLPMIGERLPHRSKSNYTGADYLHKHTMIIPAHKGIIEHIPFIVEKIGEYVRGETVNVSTSSRSGDDTQG